MEISRARRFAYLALRPNVFQITERTGEIMEVEKLISALEETISFLQNSQSSDWAHMFVEEIIEKLESEIARAKNSQSIDVKLLDLLFAPTGAIQETSIDNGWKNDFLRLSEIVEQFTGKGNIS